MGLMNSTKKSSWILDSTLWIPDSNYWIRILFQWNLDSGFQLLVLVSGIPDSYSCIPVSKAQDSRFHKQTFLRFPDSTCKNFPDSQTWGERRQKLILLLKFACNRLISGAKKSAV